jgi:hypothetical protein
MFQSKDQALDLQNGAQVLRSFHEWMVQQSHAAKTTSQKAQFSELDNQARKASYFSPTVASREPSADSSITPDPPIDLTQQANISPVAGNRPSAGKHIFRVVVSGLSIAIVVAVVWLTSRDDQTRKLVKLWGHSSVIWLSSALGTPGRDSEAAAEPSSKDQAASTPMATSTPSKEFAELRERLQTVVNDLAVLRRNVEQLSIKQEQRIGDSAPAQSAEQDVTKKTSSLVNEQLSSKQEQMSRDIATVQATEQSVSEKISSLSKAAPVHPMSRKNIPRVVHAEAPRQSAAASVPPQTSPAGAESAIDQPPRPPLPIPMSTETPSPVH